MRKSKIVEPIDTSYVRTLDGDVMVEIAPHVHVSQYALTRLGATAQKKEIPASK